MASTLTLTAVANFCSVHADLLPLTGVGGYTDEPFLSIASDAMSEIINDEQDWKWNSIETFNAVDTFGPLVTCMNKQEYLFAGASAFCLAVSAGGASVPSSGAAIAKNGVTVSGGVVTVTTLEPHRLAVGNVVNLTGLTFGTGTASNYNSAYTDNGNNCTWSTGYTLTGVTATSFTFAAITGQNNGDVGGAPGISNFGWLSGCSMMELNNNSSPPNWRQVKAVRALPKWSRVNDPEAVTVIQDYGTGVIRVRFSYVPGGVVWLVNLIYQAAAPIFTEVMYSTWSPIPDQYGDLIRQATMYRMYRYLSPTSQATINERKNLDMMIAKAKGHDSAEESNVYLEPTESLMDGYWPSAQGGM